MNIFVLHEDPALSAKYHCDKHIVKMALETAQIISTIVEGPYRPTHKHHPCVIWAGESIANMGWLYELGREICKEYTRRFGKKHKCEEVIRGMCTSIICKLPREASTPFVQCMPDIYKGPNTVDAYRRYYHSKTFAEWKYCNPPSWWQDPQYLLIGQESNGN